MQNEKKNLKHIFRENSNVKSTGTLCETNAHMLADKKAFKNFLNTDMVIFVQKPIYNTLLYVFAYPYASHNTAVAMQNKRQQEFEAD